jgi:hypothetical protein
MNVSETGFAARHCADGADGTLIGPARIAAGASACTGSGGTDQD